MPVTAPLWQDQARGRLPGVLVEMMRRVRTGAVARNYGLALVLAGLFLAAPSYAEVKAGTDAWARGDYAGAIAQWQAPAAAGDPDAQFNLAQAYRLGRGVQRNLVRAEELFARAAAQGHVQAADNYGLLMFDRGERTAAMPYVRAAAERGDPRAQYLLGIAHFNGDLAPRDWTRAYALMTLAQAAGLPQAAPALTEMDRNIPVAQRQAAATLATQLAQSAEAKRASQLAAADLAPPVPRPAAPVSAIKTPAARPAAVPAPAAAIPAAVAVAAASSPATAGADYARPPVPVAAPPRPAPPVATAPKPIVAPKAAPRPAPSGKWRVQLGAFGVAANADTLWAKARARPELSGHPRLDVRAGKVIKLQAAGFASREAASAACAALGKGGLTCLPVEN